MKNLKKIQKRPFLSLGLVLVAALISLGCSDSTSETGGGVNPLSAYSSTTSPTTVVTTNTQGVGTLDSPIVTVPTDTRSDHTNAPLLDNNHPGWQQEACLSCHTDQSRIPDHSYTDTSLCYRCHGANGLTIYGDANPPSIRGVVAAPTGTSVTVTWQTDEECLSRLTLKTIDGDKLEFPVSTTYKTSHKYTVDGLLPDTNYNFEISVTDKHANKTSSTSFGVLSFRTQSAVEVPTTTATGTTNPDTGSTFFVYFSPEVEDQNTIKVSYKTIANPQECIIHFANLDLGTKFTYACPTNVTEYIYTWRNAIASTNYSIWIEAKDDAGKDQKTSKKKRTTPKFD